MTTATPYPACPEVRVVLINPPQSYPVRLADEYQSYFPVGIASLGASLEQLGAQVRLIDCLADPHERRVGDLVWFGTDLADLKAEIAAFAPHVVGIANPFSMFASDAIHVADMVKSIDPAIKVIVGGIEASIAPNNRRLLENSLSIDILVKGEGELTLCDLTARFSVDTKQFVDLPDVAGILFRDSSGTVVENGPRPWIANLDVLPMPAYHLLDLDRMYDNPHYGKFRLRAQGTRCLPIHTSRGCPYSCNFCSVHSQVGKLFRRQSPATVVKHIEHVKRTYGVTHVHFEDDNLTLNPKHTVQLLNAIQPLGITFDTPNGIRADTITQDVARLLRAAGARSVTIAVESGVQDILDKVVRKALDLDDVVSAAKALDEADIPCLAFFIIGFPGESEKEVRGTLQFAKALTADFATANLLFVANPLPATPLHHECEENGYLTRELDKESLFAAIRLNQAPLIRTKEFTKDDLFRWAREELQIPGFLTRGTTIPLFVADTDRARVRTSTFVGGNVAEQPAYPWEAGLHEGLA
jgi:anaerobic magnesium-protoporphyrin IX monomethyl ester cyclase